MSFENAFHDNFYEQLALNVIKNHPTANATAIIKKKSKKQPDKHQIQCYQEILFFIFFCKRMREILSSIITLPIIVESKFKRRFFFTLRYTFDNKCGHGIVAAREVTPGSAIHIAAIR